MRFDHFAYAGRDLDVLIERFERLSGVRPRLGGRHPGRGTMNALASLGGEVYLELLALDPSQSGQGDTSRRIDLLTQPCLFFYMLRGSRLEDARDTMRRHGIEADLFDASRQTPDGGMLRWRLLVPKADNPFGMMTPNCIDWLDSVHPATTSIAGCSFEAFEMGHPEPDKLRALLADLGADIKLHRADRPFMRLAIGTPKGPLLLTG
ncbi:MAG TPA: VOC family protein [Burkholderiaceae bacterium]|nr:VOC family protein [Burkholderiaceae bacterium]